MPSIVVCIENVHAESIANIEHVCVGTLFGSVG